MIHEKLYFGNKINHIKYTGNANRNTFSGEVNRQQLEYYQRKSGNVFIPETITRSYVVPGPVEPDTSTHTTRSKFSGCCDRTSMEVQSKFKHSSLETCSAVNASPQESVRSSQQPRTSQTPYHINSTIISSDSPGSAGCAGCVSPDTTSHRHSESNHANTRTHGVDLLDSHYSQEVQHQPSVCIASVSDKIMIRLPHCTELQLLERAFSQRPSNQAQDCQSVKLTISHPRAEESWKIEYRLPQNRLTTLRKALGAMYDSQCADFQFVDMTFRYVSYSPPLRRNESDLQELDSERILVQIPSQSSDIELLRLAVSQGCCETGASASHRLVQVSTFPTDAETAESIIYYPSSHLQSLQDVLNNSHSNGDIAEIHVRYLSNPAELLH